MSVNRNPRETPWRKLLPFVNLVFLLWFPVWSSSSLSSSLPLFSRLLMMLLWWKGSRLKIRLRFIDVLRFEPPSPGMDVAVEAFPWNRPLAVDRNFICCCGCERKLFSSFFFSSCGPTSSFFFCSSTESSSFSWRTGRLSERRHRGRTGRRLWGQEGWKST